jgi:hypothetical protein
MIGRPEHIFVWFFDFYWLTGSFDLVIFSELDVVASDLGSSIKTAFSDLRSSIWSLCFQLWHALSFWRHHRHVLGYGFGLSPAPRVRSDPQDDVVNDLFLCFPLGILVG